MTASRSVVELPASALPQLSAAIAGVLSNNLPDQPTLVAMLELGYLAASADGLDDTERDELATILAKATKRDRVMIDVVAFRSHFEDLDAAVAMLGRRERLARTAAEFETEALRTSAIKFATLVAMADGTLHEHELGVLAEAAAHFNWTADRVRALVDEVAKGFPT